MTRPFDLSALVPVAPGWSVDWARIWPLWPELAALDTCPQDPLHHAEGDAGTHTRMVVEALVGSPEWRGLDPEDRATLFWAAVLHDVGKPACTRAEEDGRITSAGHSRIGAGIARSLLWQAEAAFPLREAVCGLIVAHQLPFWLIERSDPARLAIETSWRCRPDWLCAHAMADAEGRVCADQQRLFDNIALTREQFREVGCLEGPFPFANDESRVAFFEREDRDPHFAAHEEFRCTVTVMSGLPGAGKDHWIARHMPEAPVVSLDAIRAETGTKPTEDQGRVVQMARERAREHLRAGRDFVWNGTNVTRQNRGRLLRLLRDYGARIEIVYLEPAPARLMSQNRTREASVPQQVIETLAAKLEPPLPEEAHLIRLEVENR
ncbi:MAG: AAA family ATPase [Rhodobacteraceae bacterium]|nr:AAA family ATPase [Paracoccaceae bacterium]